MNIDMITGRMGLLFKTFRPTYEVLNLSQKRVNVVLLHPLLPSESGRKTDYEQQLEVFEYIKKTYTVMGYNVIYEEKPLSIIERIKLVISRIPR